MYRNWSLYPQNMDTKHPHGTKTLSLLKGKQYRETRKTTTNNNNIFISYIKYTNITPPANSKANRGRWCVDGLRFITKSWSEKLEPYLKTKKSDHSKLANILSFQGTTALFALQRGVFCTKWLLHAKGPLNSLTPALECNALPINWSGESARVALFPK